jgi:hypothetical protein
MYIYIILRLRVKTSVGEINRKTCLYVQKSSICSSLRALANQDLISYGLFSWYILCIHVHKMYILCNYNLHVM